MSAIPFTVAWQRDVQTIGTFTSANNTFDLYAYNASPPAVNTQAATVASFNGTITAGSPGTLVVNSGTTPILGTGLSINSAGVIAGSYFKSVSGSVFTLGANYPSNVGPEAMVWQSVMCSVPANLSGNVDLSGTSSSAAVNGWSVAIAGSNCTPPPGIVCSFYVSPTGNDSNTGLAVSTPFQTLGKMQTALESLAGSGTGVGCLMGGTYARTTTLSLTNASDANNIWIAFPGQVPVLDGGGTTAQGILIMEPNVTISGLTVQNFPTLGIQCGNGTGPIVSGCDITNNTVLNTTDPTLFGGFSHTWCILLQDAPNSAISGNTCSNSAGFGIGYISNHDTIGQTTATNNTITNVCNGGVSDCGGAVLGSLRTPPTRQSQPDMS